MLVTQFFRINGDGNETCFHVVTDKSLSIQHITKLEPFFQEFPEQVIVVQNPNMQKNVFEFGTRPNYFTPWSTDAVSILKDCGLPVVRVEETRRIILRDDKTGFNIGSYFDRMTECSYPLDNSRFLLSGMDAQPEKVFTIPVLEEGVSVLREVSDEYGLAFDEGFLPHYVQIFKELGRNPTIVELFQIGQMCSDHSCHITWNAKLKLNGETMPFTLFDLAKAPYKARIAKGDTNHIIAFHDNASAIRGFPVNALIVTPDGKYIEQEEFRQIVAGAETHCYPSTVSPFEGAITGLVGCYRDPQGTGRGGVLLYSSAGYSVGHLRIPGYHIPGEEFTPNKYPSTIATPLQIKLGASAGAWAGGNRCGVPVLHGFSRSVEFIVDANGTPERYGYLKTIMYAGNTAYVLAEHTVKGRAKKGMKVSQIGGAAYLVGLGGASGSSQILGSQDEELDFSAVQRGNPLMARVVANVIRRCIELGIKNPIISIHDQGAGGPCNVITELIEKTGGVIRLYKINKGDPTMSTVQIWCAEYQERQGILIHPDNIELFKTICDEEGCPCEILGETTDDGKIIVYATPEDEEKGNACVDLPIERVISGLPETIIEDTDTKSYGKPLVLPDDLTVAEAMKKVVKQEDTGSKKYLVHRVDRSVGGLVRQQQCCGPLQLPVADVAVSALSHFTRHGMASALGEQPTMMMLNQEAGGRMPLVEAITNLMWARVTDWKDISFSANYMWPARSPGEMCKLYRAAKSLHDFSFELGLGQDGGKDSSSLAVKMKGELIKSLETLVIKAYCSIEDVRKVITPDIKLPGQSSLIHIDLAYGKRRLGGSALAQAHGQIGDECPDMNDAALLIRTFNLMMQFIDQCMVLSGHDTTSDGFAVTIQEMTFAGNCGINVNIPGKEHVFNELFAKEAGCIIEVKKDNESAIMSSLEKAEIPALLVGRTTADKTISISHLGKEIYNINTDQGRLDWEETSYQLDRLQITPECADAERKNTAIGRPPICKLSFVPEKPLPTNLSRIKKPKVAILREKGTNGEREMAAAFKYVGFDVREILMKKLISGQLNLDGFSGIVWPGGFTFMDVFGAGKGWALKTQSNQRLKEMFLNFRADLSKWSLGICNGDQVMKWLGWLYPEMGNNHPLSVQNVSKAFESRWLNVSIPENTKSMMLKGMGGTKMGVYVAHGEGQFWTPNGKADYFLENGLVGMQFIDPDGNPTEDYPFNPNGSINGITSLCSECGNHLAMMPHPERTFQRSRLPWMPADWKNLKASPWLQIFINSYDRSIENM